MKTKNQIKKRFIKNVAIFLDSREKILNSFKSKIFPITNLGKTPTPEPNTDPTVFDAPKQQKHKLRKVKQVSIKIV